MAQGLAARQGYPSVSRARYWVVHAKTEAALTELAACVDLKIDAQQAAELHDDLLVDLALREERVPEAWKAAEAHYYSETPRRKVLEHALNVTIAKAEHLQQMGEQRASADLLELIPPDLAGGDRVSSLRFALAQQQVLACARQQDLTCAKQVLRWADKSRGLRPEDIEVIGKEVNSILLPAIERLWRITRATGGDPRKKLAACEELQGPIDFVEEVRSSAARLPVTSGKLTDVCMDLRIEIRDREEWEAQQRERRRRQAQARWGQAPLLCRDGTLSPTCICGQSSRRGCCSHHGGVQGCSAAYPD